MITINQTTYRLSDSVLFDYDLENILVYLKGYKYIFAPKSIDLFIDLADDNILKEYSIKLIPIISKLISKNFIEESIFNDRYIDSPKVKFFNRISFSSNEKLFSLINHRKDISNYGINRMLNHHYFTRETTNFSIYIMFSYKCNMKCKYCFESESAKEPIIPMETLRKHLDNYVKGVDSTIIFYGGEPLLKENIMKINTIADWYPNNNYRIITNGINIRKYISALERIKDNNLCVVITIDGPEEIQNKRRVSRNGYKEIISGLEMLIELEVQIIIRINVDYENIEYIQDLIKELNVRFRNYNLIEIVIHRVAKRTSENYSQVKLLDLFKLNTKIKESQIKIRYGDRALDHLLNSDIYFANGDIDLEFSCDYLNQVVIAPDGMLYHCNEGMGNEFMKIDREYTLEEIRDKFDITRKCNCCSYYEICKGGCLYQNYLNSNIFDKNYRCSLVEEFDDLYKSINQKNQDC